MPDRAAIQQLIDDLGVDSTLELFDIFKEDAELRLSEIEARRNADGELKELKLHAHSLKGVCRTYGLPRSGDLAFALEQAVTNDDREAARTAADVVLAEVPSEIAEAMALIKSMAAAG